MKSKQEFERELNIIKMSIDTMPAFIRYEKSINYRYKQYEVGLITYDEALSLVRGEN